MSNYRTTVILKTDIVDSTPRLAEQTQGEMGLQRKQHRRFIADIAVNYRGSVFQEEGDAYLMEFPSVTDAVLAAIEMHQNLLSTQAGKGEKGRLAIRAVITVGDILHQGEDAIGMSMSLTARMEKITPPDEIYLSHAAWLVLNKAEVQTSFVGKFDLKGFKEPEQIYKVDQKHRVRILNDQFIVFTDIRGWTNFMRTSDNKEIETFLSRYDDLLNSVCDNHGGIIRNASGDQYFLTFSESNSLFKALEDLFTSWKELVKKYHLGLSIAVHKGTINIIRSYLYSNDIHLTIFLERLNGILSPNKASISIIATNKVREGTIGTKWENRFHGVEMEKISDAKIFSIAEDVRAYLFIPGED